ncbi:MAG: hydrogenase, partial [Lentisphaerota bacterium]
IGGLAVACFVKVYGAVFLGTARCSKLPVPHEAPGTMIGPMLLLAACCVLIGLAPWAVAPILDAASSGWVGLAQPGIGHLADWAPLYSLSAAALALTVAVSCAFIFLRQWMVHRGTASAPTWGCGYSQPSPRIQYTASSFAQLLTYLFRGFLRMQARWPVSQKMFAPPAHFETHVEDWALDRTLLPAFRRMKQGFLPLRRFQQGLTNHYLAYMLFAVAALLVWAMPIKSMVMKLFMR